jgi:exopolyphosphatase/guanosine-5'-triphosphate,3'-diphosphate pyrophosphatase
VTRVAAVDLGTNSLRLLVADVAPRGSEPQSPIEVLRETRIVRLGEGVDERRRLLPEPIARARNVLVDFRLRAEELGAERVLLVATSAVRDAENGEAFLGEIEWSYGFATRLLSGEEEAELTYRGVGRHDALVVDVGGGSTELIGPDIHVSLDVGSVRLTERHLRSDPPSAEELDAAAAFVRSLLPPLVHTCTIGVAGTLTTLAALELGGYDPARTHGFGLRRDAVERWTDMLASVPLAQRAFPGLEPARAPVIVGGALIVRELMRHAGLDAIEISERDLLDGAALLAAELPEPQEGTVPPGGGLSHQTCC